jgi:hypothetical protein
MVHKFIDITNDLVLSSKSTTINKFSKLGDKLGDPKTDFLDDDQTLLLPMSW